VATIELKRILCPIDLSACSRHALLHALALARWYDAKLTILHVLEPLATWPQEEPDAARQASARQAGIAAVASFVRPLNAPPVPTEIIVDEGPVADRIVDAAVRTAADLIVAGTHGRGGVERLMLGSVTEKMLRKARCAVLVVPPAAGSAHPAVRFAHILCPVDFGPSSMRGLEYAISLAQQGSATVTVLHVVEALDVEWLPDVMLEARLGLDRLRREREESAHNRLRDAVPDEARARCRLIELVTGGKPYQEILRVARQAAADLIVIGIAGRGPVDLMFFGSTANHVVRRAECPVLIVRAPIEPSRRDEAENLEDPVARR
jgi:nucleotide-binding universal stress UspA family protein